jgi:release factor glutamine methyltransferase
VTPPAGTLGALLDEAVRRLAGAGIDAPEAAAEFALADLLDCTRAELRLRRAEPVTADIAARYEPAVRRLAAGEPLAYVTGWAPFLDLRIACDRRALIPRPETEELAQRVLEGADPWARPAPCVADIGTGTGCLAIAFALARPHADLIGIDRSPDALALARENAQRLGARSVRWIEGDGCAPLAGGACDALVANLPYVTTGEWSALDRSVRAFEPRAALDGGADGLDPIRRLIADAPRVLKPGGRLFLEIGETQGPAVEALLHNAGFEAVALQRDGFGNIRFAESALPGAGGGRVQMSGQGSGFGVQ